MRRGGGGGGAAGVRRPAAAAAGTAAGLGGGATARQWQRAQNAGETGAPAAGRGARALAGGALPAPDEGDLHGAEPGRVSQTAACAGPLL